MIFPIAVIALFALSATIVVFGRHRLVRVLSFSVAAACLPIRFWILYHEVLSPPPQFVTSAGRAGEDGSYHDEFRMDLGRGVYSVTARFELPADSEIVDSRYEFNLDLKGHEHNQNEKDVACTLKPGPNVIHIADFRITKNRDELTLRFLLTLQPGIAEVPIQLSVDRKVTEN